MQVEELETAAPSDASHTNSRSVSMPKSRGYQQEMLEESLSRNIVIALDTGAGKTHIAVLRMKLEVERELAKVSRPATTRVAYTHGHPRYAGFWHRQSHSQTSSIA